jgi:predicted O-methyltransferase YrrM
MDIQKFDKHISDSYKTCSWINLYHGNLETLLRKLPKPTTYVEIGLAYGFHMETMLQAFNDLKCYGIDPYIPYDSTDGFNYIGKIDTTISVKENFDLFSLSVSQRLSKYSNFTHIRETSQTCYNQFEDESIDLVFVDGEHTYEAVKSDCNLWWNKIKNGGIMAWDDYNNPSAPGTQKAINEFCEQKKLKLQFISNGRNNGNYNTAYSFK